MPREIDLVARARYSELARKADDRIEQIISRVKLRGAEQAPTMDDFWMEMGWFEKSRDGSLKLRRAKWKGNEQVQITAIRYTVNCVLAKNPRDMVGEDFENNKLCGLLSDYYNGSIFDIASKAFPEFDIRPWEMKVTPNGFYKHRNNRGDAVKWLVDKVKKDPRDLTEGDFIQNRLGGLLSNYFNFSPYGAVSETYPELKIKPWEMLTTPQGFYNEGKNRIAAVRWLVAKLKKNRRDVTKEDFYENRLGGLLSSRFNDSPFDALFEARFVKESDADGMRKRGNARLELLRKR
jgi:hypothetical protein